MPIWQAAAHLLVCACLLLCLERPGAVYAQSAEAGNRPRRLHAASSERPQHRRTQPASASSGTMCDRDQHTEWVSLSMRNQPGRGQHHV